MYFVYVLQNTATGRLYVGLTANISRRSNEHNQGRVFSTKGYRPWTLVYTEQCRTRPEARVREKYLKSGFGKEYLKTIIMPR